MKSDAQRPSVRTPEVDNFNSNQDRNQTMFTPVHARAASAYKRVDVETMVDGADPHQLTQLLFKALLQSLGTAKIQMEQGDIAAKCKTMSHAVRILQEGLNAAVDVEQGGEIAANLKALYDYCSLRLTLGNMRNDLAILDEVIGLIDQIFKAWVEIRPTAGQGVGHA